MNRFSEVSLFAQDFKCFGAESQGFAEIKPMNVIIGRNNTGKSALVDLVQSAIQHGPLNEHNHLHRVEPVLRMALPLQDDEVKRAFRRPVIDGRLAERDTELEGRLTGKRVVLRFLPQEGSSPMAFESVDTEYTPEQRKMLENIPPSVRNPFRECFFVRLSADRDMAPESDVSPHGDPQSLTVEVNGRGATNLLQRVLYDETLPHELVEQSLLADLNGIMAPDATFTRIGAQRTGPDDNWTVVLDEQGKGRISLSESGSGLKTVLLVLLDLLVLPRLQKKDPGTFVYAFEELENNLHPGLQRRLLTYVRDKVREMNATCFVTTHSPVVIDLLGGAGDSQILHVTHDGRTATVQPVGGRRDGHGVLDDLDVRASDLLQANGVVWVEGITDAILIRRWIQLYCESQVPPLPVPSEGLEYTFMEYGGRCLNHLDFGDASLSEIRNADVEWLIDAMSISRNAFIVMDSDKANDGASISRTKRRAMRTAPGSWITKGREIENYVSPEITAVVLGGVLAPFESAASVYCEAKGKRRFDKKSGALQAASLLTTENWKHMDLEKRIGQLVARIRSWNQRTDTVDA